MATDVTARLRQDERDPNHDYARNRDSTPVVGARGPGVDYLSIKARLHARLLDEIGERSMYGSGEEAIARAVTEFVAHVLQTENVPLNQEERDKLAEELKNETLGVGPLAPLMADPAVT